MTADIFRAVFAELDFGKTQHYKDMYTNAKERRLIKNAIRLLRSQKIVPTWESYVEHVLKDKISLDDPRKAAEMKSYFEAELVKKEQPASKSAKVNNTDKDETSQL